MVNQLNNFISNLNNTALTASEDILRYINMPNIRDDEKLANYMTMLKGFKEMVTNQFNILYQNSQSSQYSDISYDLCSSTFLKLLTFMFGHGGILYHRIFNNHTEFAYPKSEIEEYGATNLIILWRDLFTFKWNTYTNNNDAYRSFIDIQYILDNTYQSLLTAVNSADVDRLDVYNQSMYSVRHNVLNMFVSNFNQNVLSSFINQDDYYTIYNELDNADLIGMLTDYAIHKSFINYESSIPFIYSIVINETYIHYIIRDYLYYNIVGLFELLFTTVDNYQYIETSIIAQGIRMIIDKIGGI